MRDKVYYGELERFGYVLTSIGRTRGEVEKALIDSYRKAYINANGTDPKEDRIPYSDETYQELAEREAFITEFRYGDVKWL